MTEALWSIIPRYVPSYVPGWPMASLNSSPPTTTVWPRAAAPSIRARMLRCETVDSTNTALILRSTSRLTSRSMSRTPASDSVERPWIPTTS